MKRIIPLKSVHNLRTLGTLINCEGRMIRANILLRSASLDRLSHHDARILKEKYQLSLIIDLRTAEEVRKKPDRKIKGVTYLHLSICADAIPGVSREMEPGRNMDEGMLPEMKDMYRELVSHPEYQEGFARVLKTIMHHRGGSVLFHCTAGKDRCGLTAMFLLRLLGVSEETILADYLLTNLDTKKTADRYAFFVGTLLRRKELAAKIRRAYLADEDYLNAALQAIEREFGGMDSYLHQVLKLEEEEIREFRNYALKEVQ